MKRKLITLIILLALLTTLVGPAAAENIKVFINDSQKNFNPAPMIKSGTTLVPMRAFFESLGAQVSWDGTTQTVIGKRNGVAVKLTIDSSTAEVNGTLRSLTVPAQLINGSTYIPLRFVGEALGDSVNWNGSNRTITIKSSHAVNSSELLVHFIDVGQADSIYIEAPDNYDILIDAGNNEDGDLVVNYLKSRGVDDIEIMIATHPHEDHIGGLDDVLSSFKVEKIIDSGEAANTATYKDYWKAVQAEKANYQEDSNLVFDLGNNIKFYVIETGDGYSNVNDNSVLTKLDYNNVEILFTGDMESDIESSILKKDISADILKVGHHGSRSSSSLSFLKQVNPKDAIISVGAGNSYGHPHQETLDALKNNGINIYRTDVSGTIVATTDGSTYSINASSWKESNISPNNGTSNIKPEVGKEKVYVGSINSDKYHYPSCTYAKKIAAGNQVWFKTKAEAAAAGYVPCKVCKP